MITLQARELKALANHAGAFSLGSHFCYLPYNKIGCMDLRIALQLARFMNTKSPKAIEV